MNICGDTIFQDYTGDVAVCNLPHNHGGAHEYTIKDTGEAR